MKLVYSLKVQSLITEQNSKKLKWKIAGILDCSKIERKPVPVAIFEKPLNPQIFISLVGFDHGCALLTFFILFYNQMSNHFSENW